MSKKFFYWLPFLVLLTRICQAQVSENFNDGDFANDPVWQGNVTDFIVNDSLQLKSNNQEENTIYYLSTASTLATSCQWECWLRLAFNPSSANYVDVYLTSSSQDLTGNSNTGYFVRIGNTDDEISLYRKDANNVITKIIDGTNGVLNHGNNVLKIKIVRDDANKWILYTDASGTGNSYVSEGSVVDGTFVTSAFFGIAIKQSTASFFQKHFFDDIEIKQMIPDLMPPEIQSATAIASDKLDLLFSEALEKSSAGIFSNYSANELGMPVSAEIDALNASLLHLIFADSFTNGKLYTISVEGVKDLAGNAMNSGKATFTFYIPQRYDVVIDEIFADPTPQIGLPDYEWIELKNTSSFNINLKNWRLKDMTGFSGPMPDYLLRSDSFVIVCDSSAVSSLSSFGKAISVTSFPSLDNDGEIISIADADGNIVHSISYSSEWYQNSLKKNGGWSLEMIDCKNPCNGASNWIASKSESGGTPGKINSVNGVNKDDSPPKLSRAFANDLNTITVIFQEPVDSAEAASAASYTFDNGLSAAHVVAISPVFDRVEITMNSPLKEGVIYQVGCKGISDCAGNMIDAKNTVRFGLASPAGHFDLVINEIMFNPLPSGVDYVELYNRSSKIIDLSKLYLANKENNVAANFQQVAGERILFFPGDFLALTVDPAAVKTQYIAINPDAFLKMKTLPSFPDDKGWAGVVDNQGNVIDEVSYSDKWHFPLLHNSEGVSLERINFNDSSDQKNFHSASTSAGYGTPGYKNSQSQMNEVVPGEITVSPEIFSPDNDGVDDFVTINYSFPTPGYVATISVFDASGRLVRSLEKNALNGIKGYYRWDGLDDKNRKLSQGIYIIYTEVFNKEGRKKQFRNTVVLARRNL
jgi:hypothetical protein